MPEAVRDGRPALAWRPRGVSTGPGQMVLARMPRLATAEHRPGQVDRERVIPLLQIDAAEAELAEPDADIEHHAIDAAESLDRLPDHAANVFLARNVGRD